MPIGLKVLQSAAFAGALLLMMMPAAQAQQAGVDPCTAQDKRQACSYQCCGRRACPPSCEVDCVKTCVDACSSPARSLNYTNRLRDLQLRCGNRSVR